MDSYRAGLVAELERRRELTVSRVGPNGLPVGATVAYCNDGAMIYFVAPGDSELFAGLEPHAQVSLALGDCAARSALAGLKQTRLTLPVSSGGGGASLPLSALISEVTDPAERARAVRLLGDRYPGLARVMQRACENGFRMRTMRAVPFVGLAPSRPANAA